MSHAALLEQARAILKENDQGNTTRPAPRLYPHQWLWDSCFIAIGLRHNNPERAMAEIHSLFRGQWKNGMIPHMIFADDIEYHAGPEMWQSDTFAEAPDGVRTSCITQPPVIAEAMIKIGEKVDEATRKEFYQAHIAQLIDYHQWLYDERDPKNTGLVTLIHAWECGIEDTPYWAKAMEAAAPDEVAAAREHGSFVELDAARPDTKHAPLEQRPSSADYYSLYHTFELVKSAGFRLGDIESQTKAPLVVDSFFNCILNRANHCLLSIAAEINVEVPETLRAKMAKTDEVLKQMVREAEDGRIQSIDYRTGMPIDEASIAELMPLYGFELDREISERIVSRLSSEAYWPRYGVATVPTDSPWYGEVRFWQGPVWINTNWLLVEGLMRNGYRAEAVQLVDSTLEMADGKDSIYEYYSAKTGSTAGTHTFSWSAALVIDMILGNEE